MKDLKITLCQSDIVWEDRTTNLNRIEDIISRIDPGTQLIILPEMFTTGFSMEPERIAEHYEAENMETLQRMKTWSGKTGAVLTGSVSTADKGKYYNRLFWVRPDGTFSYYDKRHLFSLAGEDEHYTAGMSTITEEISGWKICPLICYDLRFPVWSRNRLVNGKPIYDLLIYVANWPEVRREPWKKLLLARAIENQSYVVGVNRIGVDAGGFIHSGDSSVINPRGEYVAELNPGMEDVRSVVLGRGYLEEFRERFTVLEDADDFELK